MASTVFDTTAAQAVLKELYDGQGVQNLVYKLNPFFALVDKMEDFQGKNYPIPVIIGTSQGRSADFTTAQSNQTALNAQEFLLTRKKDYSLAQITQEMMLVSKSDKGAFVNGVKAVTDNAFRVITNSLASGMFRSGTGSIGQYSAISTGVITLTNAADAVQFEANMLLRSYATDGGTDRGSDGFVIAVDRTAGTVTVSLTLGGAAATPASWAGNDFLAAKGDVNAKMSGLLAWLPTSAPTSTPFYGVDRSVDPVRLGGVRYDGTPQAIEEALIDASALVAREGGTPDVCVMSFASFGALLKALGTKVQYVTQPHKSADISFRGIEINGHNSVIRVFPDRNCPAKVAFLLQMDTWKLYSAGEAPQILRYGDGIDMLRVYNADAAEIRIGAFVNLGCNAPGWNAVVQLSA